MKKIYTSIMLGLGILSYAQVGTTCADPIVITSLPYTTTDDTANYADNYDPPTSSSPSCPSTTYGNYYHGGNDVIYAYTPTTSGTIKIEMPNVVGWTGMFVYTDCSNIGVSYAACAVGVSPGTRLIDNFPVTAGQTYYILLSSWPSPQTFAYTLNITSLTLATSEVQLNDTKAFFYPNPSQKTVHFRTESPVISAIVYSMEGKIVREVKVQENQMDIEFLPKGNYILGFTVKEGQTYHKKLIKN